MEAPGDPGVRHQQYTCRPMIANLLYFLESTVQGENQCCLSSSVPKGKGGVLHATDPSNPDDPASPSVLDVLKLKHPPARPATRMLKHGEKSA